MHPGSGGDFPRSIVWKRTVRIAFCAVLTVGATDAAGQVRSRMSPATPSPTLLVNSDEELASYLAKAEALIAEKQYEQAINILQPLILRSDSGFLPIASDNKENRFVSLHLKASELIGRMDAEGLALYRGLYDAQAKQLYEEAIAGGDEGLLRRIVYRYLHTSAGAAALDRLGAIHFDHGRFEEAAGAWRRVLALRAQAPAEVRGVLLAKIAAASHLAGNAPAARKVAEELAAQYAGVEADIGGKRQKLTDFVAAIETLPAARTGGVKNFMNSWPGMGGISDGLGVMGDSRVVLVPRWKYPQPEGGSEDSVPESPERIATTNLPIISSSRGRQQQTTEELLGGQVVRKTRGGGMAYAQVLPATVWPVVAEETVIFRTSESVMALDLLTGKVVGSTGSLLPMERTRQASGSRSRYYGGYQMPTGDDGRYALTIGGGKVFALGNFRPLTIDPSSGWGAAPDKPADPDTSTLAALSIRAGLKLLWTAGRDSDDPLLRAGKFVTAPTYHAGRVYAVLIHLEGYHLVCLDAASGSLLWKSAISQLPPMREGYYRAMMGILFERVSPPAVADGRVFVLTNAGVLAAYDADTGQAVWACQYESDVNRGGGGYYGGFSPQQTIQSANPLFVADGKVLCLPADSNFLLAVSTDDGRTLWTLPRDGQRDLSLIDEQRVLLSGEGLMIVSLADRTKKFERTWMPFPGEPQGIYGRPAVTPDAVLAGGISGGVGRVYRLDLRTYELSEVQLNHADGLLGNLVSAGGKLLAANSTGVCAYFDYATARGMMTARLEKAFPGQRPRLMLERSQVALRSGQYADALADALECRQLNESAKDESLAETLRHHLYRTYVSVANHAETPQRMLELFLQAQEAAVTDLNRRTMAVRLVRCYEAAGDLGKAAAMAQEISDAHSEEQYPDVRIGPDADDARRLGQEARFYRGREMGQEILLRGMIERHGRGFYAEFDAEARRAFEAARSRDDPDALVACADRWPNSDCASEARFVAGEMFYHRGEEHLRAGRRAPAWEQFDAAMRQLDRVIAQSDHQTLTVSAAVAVAAMYAKMGRPDAAAQQADRAREISDRAGGTGDVAFADLRGPLEEVLARLKISPSAHARRTSPAFLKPPLRDVYSLEGKGLLILRDQDSRPLTIGQGLLVLNGSDAVLLDTAADSYENAIRWRALAQVDGEQFLGRWTGTPPAMCLLAAPGADGQTFILATRETVRWFETRGGKAIDEKTFAELGITSFASMAVGEGMLLVAGTDGTLACVDLSARKTLWRARLPGKNPAPTTVMSIRGGRVLVTNDQGRRMTCYSLAEGGRVVGEWQGANLEGYLADDGLVVVALGNEVSVHETGHAAKTLWKRKYDSGSGMSLLAASARGIAVWTGREGKIEVLALLAVEEGGRVLNTLQLPDAINLTPADAVLDGESLYVVCGSARRVSGRQRVYWNTAVICYGLYVVKFDLGGSGGQPAWSSVLESNNSMPFYTVPMTVGRGHLVVTSRPANYQAATSAYVLDAADGQTVRQVPLSGSGQRDNFALRRRMAIGPAVMTNNRLCVQTEDGMTILGGQ